MKNHKKNNVRSFRYSDEVAAILQQHNNDLDALVLECFYKLPEIKKMVVDEQKIYSDLCTKEHFLHMQISRLEAIKRELDCLEKCIHGSVDRINGIGSL